MPDSSAFQFDLMVLDGENLIVETKTVYVPHAVMDIGNCTECILLLETLWIATVERIHILMSTPTTP